MRAEPARQQRLLDLQAVDTRLAQLDHRARTLPEHAELQDLEGQRDRLEAEAVRTRTEHDDVQRELAKAEADVQLVRDRADRDRVRLESGAGSAKDLQALQHEIESLARRQATLEDEELEVMERAEQAQTRLDDIETRLAQVRQRVDEVTAARDARLDEVGAERAEVAATREGIAGAVGDDLLALYDKVRVHSGTGAAALVQRRCGGCQLELNTVELGRIKAAPEDEVLRCEECRRILVRTPESGV